MRDRASDLRAIAEGRLMLNVRNGVTVARSMLARIADEFEAMSTALAAKDAELAEVRQQYVDANEARIDAEAQLADARQAVALFENYGCPVCHGDCASANPPVPFCPMEIARRVREGGKADGPLP